MKALLLRGREHPDVGALGEAACGDVAAAISRGGAPKIYPHVDPNEDAALGVAGRCGLLVAVADGHWGHRASECALEHLLAAHAEAWVDGEAPPAAGWAETLAAAVTELDAAVRACHRDEQRPRTTLALALARPAEGVVASASVGDSLLFLVQEDGIAELPRARQTGFLGSKAKRAAGVTRHMCVSIRSLGAPLALVAVTDGLSETGIGVADPAAAVRSAVAGARERAREERAREAARAVARAALDAHRSQLAGDNVAVAVAWLAA